MNPNQMNMAKTMVTMHELQDEARRSRASRRARSRQARQAKMRTAGARTKAHGLFGFLGLALPGRR